MAATGTAIHREPWNKGKLVGQKAPFEIKDIWALRVRLQMEGRVRELALFTDTGSMNSASTAPTTGRTRCAGRRQVDLPVHKEPSGRSVAAWALQARVEREIPWHRGGESDH